MSQRTYDRLKNYSTTISVEKTIMEIERMLAKFGAKKTMKEYNHKGQIVGLAFVVDTPNGDVPIKLPAKIDKIRNVFKVQVSEKILTKRYWEGDWAEEQAARTAWRTLKDWIDAQLALISIDMAKVEEIFLPYAYSARLNQTLFEAIESGKVDLPMMLNRHEPEDDDEPTIIDVEPNQ